MKKIIKPLLIGLFALVLAGCAHPDLIKMNADYPEVIKKLGQPDSVVTLEDGSKKVVYSYQPMGQECYMLVFNPQGKLVFKDKLMQEKYFKMIKPGTQNSKDIYSMFGHPCEQWTYKNLGEHTYMYRYLDETMYPMALWVDFDLKTDKVLRYVISIDPWSQQDSDWDVQ